MPKALKILVYSVIGILLAGYVIFQGYDLARGTIKNNNNTTSGDIYSDPLVTIEKKKKNISFIYLNDNQIFVDSDGQFEEKLLLLDGYNITTVRAVDKFGRSIEKELHLILRE